MEGNRIHEAVGQTGGIAGTDADYLPEVGWATLDDLDLQLLHALTIDGRAPFSRIAAVLGVSDQTVARRYHRLNIDAVHVLGRLDTHQPEADWLLRLHCIPGAAMSMADALARRTDISGVTIMSGETEVLCVVRTGTIHEPNELLLDKLTRTDHVVSVTAHRVLKTFLDRQPHWSGILTALTQAQCGALRAAIGQSALVPATAFGSQPGDEALLEVLARDGRAGYRQLAAATGWSQSTVKRRLGSLRRADSLSFDLDCDTSLFGIEMTARLWMSVAPSRLADVGAALAEHPETAFAAATTGPANLTSTVLCADADALYQYLTMRIGQLTSVQSVETTPVIRTIKCAAPSTRHIHKTLRGTPGSRR